jgi:hypothetical protein
MMSCAGRQESLWEEVLDGFWWRNLKEKDNVRDIAIDKWIILK